MRSLLKCMLLFIILGPWVYGQDRNVKIDSLQTALKNAIPDTSKVNIHNALSWEYIKTGNYEEALKHGNSALTIANKINFKKGKSGAYSKIGDVHRKQGNYPEAVKNYKEALKIDSALENRLGMADNYVRLGIINVNQGIYSVALDYYLKALKDYERLENKQKIGLVLGNIGVLYSYQQNYSMTLNYYLKALEIDRELKDKNGIARHLGNIGIIYAEQAIGETVFTRKDSLSSIALDYYFKSLKIREEIGDQYGVGGVLGNIGNVFKEQHNYHEALSYYLKALKIFESLKAKKDIALNLGNIGLMYVSEKKYDEARNYLNKALQGFTEIGAKEGIKSNLMSLSLLDSSLGNWYGAYLYHKQYTAIKDSIFNEESSKSMAEMQTKYESEKKEKEIQLQRAELSKQEAVIQQQTTQKLAFAGGFTLVLILAGVTYRSYRNKRKAHGLLEVKNKIIEEKNKDITDSINYAKNIQQAILPFDYRIKETLKEHFVFFKPRDIVSGDFYWFTEKEDFVFLAVADCTGHGVPGAFMSMIGSAILNHAVNERGLTEPGQILSEANRKIKEALKQTENSNRDGMDISLIRFEKNSLNRIQFSGAMRPLYFVDRLNGLNEVQGDKMAIGGTTDDSFRYTTHNLILEKESNLYIFSDGYVDQFGGDKGKKFMTGSFKKLLLSIKNESMHKQKQLIEEAFIKWKGNLEQIDDVCVIGVKI